ncbi:MAG: hypothetical protein ACLQJR_10310 [Stellaceae bacterium]
MTDVLPPAAAKRVRSVVAARYPELIGDPAFDATIRIAIRLDLSAGSKATYVGKSWRRVLSRAIVETLKEAAALGLRVASGRRGRGGEATHADDAAP